MRGDEAFVRRLVDQAPTLRPLFDEHIGDHGEVLAHLFMGDVVRHLYARCQEGTEQAWADVDRILAIADAGWDEGDEFVTNLLYVSLLENLIDAPEECPEVIEHLGPSLLAEYPKLLLPDPAVEAFRRPATPEEQEYVRDLTAQVPILRASLDEHVQRIGVLLPRAFMIDLRMLLEDLASQGHPQVDDVLAVIEDRVEEPGEIPADLLRHRLARALGLVRPELAARFGPRLRRAVAEASLSRPSGPPDAR